MSQLSVSQIGGIAANGNVVTVPSGHMIKQAGAVVQVVSKTSATPWSIGVTGNSTWYDYPSNELNILFTPKFSTSKILLRATISIGSGASNNAGFRFTRDGSVVGVGNVSGSRHRATSVVGYLNASDNNHQTRTISGEFLDVAGTTSAISYNIQGISEGPTLLWNRNYNYGDSLTAYNATLISTLTIMEIAQ